MKSDLLSLLKCLAGVSKKLLLVKKGLFALLADNKAIVPARAEPLDLSTLFGQRSLREKAGRT
jgi:hypothetical protein